MNLPNFEKVQTLTNKGGWILTEICGLSRDARHFWADIGGLAVFWLEDQGFFLRDLRFFGRSKGVFLQDGGSVAGGGAEGGACADRSPPDGGATDILLKNTPCGAQKTVGLAK